MLGLLGDTQSTNMYAYCANNPVMYTDSDGMLAIPFISALIGVAVLLVVYVLYAIDPTVFPSPDNIIDDLENVYNSIQNIKNNLKEEIRTVVAGLVITSISTIKKYSTGTYVVSFDSGYMYVGKGGIARMFISAAYQSARNKTMPTFFVFEPANNNDEAFMREYMWMVDLGYTTEDPGMLYNRIWSPGRSIYFAKYGHYYGTDTGY